MSTGVSKMDERAEDRQRRGAAKLIESDIFDIRRLARAWNERRGGKSTRELAEWYGVGQETIRRIVRGESWSWLGENAQEGTVKTAQLEEEGQATLARFLKEHGELVKKQEELAPDAMLADLTEEKARPPMPPNPMDEE